jgi:hypothetical protein
VADEDDRVAMLHVAQDRDEVLRGLERIVELEPGVVRRIVPRRDAGRREAEDPDAHPVDLLDEIGLVRARALRVLLERVRRQPGERRFLVRALEHGETEVVLVVADHERVVAERVHARDLRIGQAVAFRLPVGSADGVQVGERRTLDEIARVDQDRVRVLLGAHLLDQRRDLGEAVVVDRLRALVVPRQQMTVQVGRMEDRDRDPAGRRGRGGGGLRVRLLRRMPLRVRRTCRRRAT